MLHVDADKPMGARARGVRRVTALPLGLAAARHRRRRRSRRISCRRRRRDAVSRSNSSAASRSSTAPTKSSFARKALCLEEMTGRAVPEGALFYAETKRRVAVPFDADLRRLTEATIAALARGFRDRRTPPPSRKRRAAAAPARCSSSAARSRSARPVARLARRAWSRLALREEAGAVKRLLNTLYVTTEGAALRKDGENLVAEVEGAERARVPLHMLGLRRGVRRHLCLAAADRRLRGARHNDRVCSTAPAVSRRAIEGPVTGNVLLRRAQYRASETPDEIVRVVSGRQDRQPARGADARRCATMATNSPRRTADALDAAVDRWRLIGSASRAALTTLDELRGVEGEAAASISRVFDHLIRVPDAGLALARPLAPSAARRRQRAAVLPLHAADPRLPQRRRERRARSRPSASCTATGRDGRAWRSI